MPGYQGMKQGKGSAATQFRPGKSGNPSGRPKHEERHITQLARKHTAEAIAALVKALSSPRERVSAAAQLLDRGWGKPVTMIAADPERPLAVTFEWADAGGNGAVGEAKVTPNAHTDTQSPRHIGQQIEAAIIEAVVEDDSDK